MDYKHCAAVVAISDEDDHLVVAFRGTISTDQLVEQILGVLLGMIESPIGGEVGENNSDKVFRQILMSGFAKMRLFDSNQYKLSAIKHLQQILQHKIFF